MLKDFILRNKKKILIYLVVFILISVLTTVYFLFFDKKSEDISNDLDTTSLITEDLVYRNDDLPLPAWTPNVDGGPWYGDLYIAYSTDGINFTDEKFFIPHAGVANIIKGTDGELIAVFQYFSYQHEELFDIIAYTISNDNGQTWGVITPLKLSGLPQASNAVDPTLVLLDDGAYRLYFTFDAPTDKYATLYSATSDSIDGTFVSEGPQIDYDGRLLDPAVVYFNGQYHHYTTYNAEDVSVGYRNFHSVSDTGLDFVKADDIYAEMQFLGDVIVEDDYLRFYVTGDGIHSETSPDGYTWNMDEGVRVDGADPGVVKVNENSYVVIYTY